MLAPDVRVLASDEVPEDFDARRDALSRTYRYRVLADPVARVHERGRSLFWRFPLDRGALDECAALIAGVHDFTAFTRTQTIHRHFYRDVWGVIKTLSWRWALGCPPRRRWRT